MAFCHFFLDKKVTKKSRTNDIQPVRSAAMLNSCSFVVAALFLYSLKAGNQVIEIVLNFKI
jgi:hypothetical protein